jgi:hypothetical protein
MFLDHARPTQVDKKSDDIGNNFLKGREERKEFHNGQDSLLI